VPVTGVTSPRSCDLPGAKPRALCPYTRSLDFPHFRSIITAQSTLTSAFPRPCPKKAPPDTLSTLNSYISLTALTISCLSPRHLSHIDNLYACGHTREFGDNVASNYCPPHPSWLGYTHCSNFRSFSFAPLRLRYPPLQLFSVTDRALYATLLLTIALYD